MSFTRVVPLLVLVGCAAAPPVVEKKEPVSAAIIGDPIAEQAQADAEASRVLAAKYHGIAIAHRNRGELGQAEEAIRKSRALQPKNEDYRRTELWIQVNLSKRPATVTMVANEEQARQSAKREEEILTVRRFLAEARAHEHGGRWDQAKRAYERALFVLRTSRFREDDAFRTESHAAQKDLRALPDQRALEDRRRRQAALDEIARLESGE